MRPGRLLGGVLCLAAAAILAVAALDVVRVDDRLEAGDLRYAEAPPGTEAWPPASRPLVRVPDRVLGIERDERLRRALQLVRASRVDTIDATVIARLHAQAEGALLAIVRDDPDRARRALAANALGLMFDDDSRTARSDAASFVSRALEAFRASVRLDPSRAEAKRNLELLLTLARAQLEEERRIGRGGSGDESRQFGGVAVQQGY